MKTSRKIKLALMSVLIFFIAGICYIKLYKYPNMDSKKTAKALLCKLSPTWQYPPPPVERTINFPLNEAVGLLYTTIGTQSYGYDSSWEKIYGPAKGEIKLAKGTAACLEIKEGFSSVISRLEPNSIQSIDFSAPFDFPFELYTNNQTKRTVRLLDEDLKPIRNLNGLYQLVLHNTNITDKSLFYISEVKSLRLLNLWNTKITDEGLVYLAQLPFLDTIYIGATNISDKGLEYISNLTRLRCLWLTGSNRCKGRNIATATSINPNITDIGIYHLATLPSLENLNISGTNITDGSVNTLSQIKSLRILDISRTRITENGVRKLQAALPDCQIINSLGMIDK